MSVTLPQGLNPTQLDEFVRLGVYDYSDLATQTAPIPVTANTITYLTNDALGFLTNTAYGLSDVPVLWDNNEFTWQHLNMGDVVDIRTDLRVTTTQPNQRVEVDLMLGLGDVNEYAIAFAETTFKSVGTYIMNNYSSIYMGNSLTKENPAKFFVRSDEDASVVVNGWYCKVLKKGM